ncbi:beta-ketoacyl-[acyl-carrier-protein] synthase family protein [Shewanella olleyana]|uniref:beta-ketoacyl-[acyl-carrier-protein] synthase family protein n=1 Tax=Shewanella olleyana TaxID=135626 RepID=UPI00200C4007|nr:beta-ketoacyl-[acyl-carrier-protein] synthase family protein [Shewanella olleyana]MCL1066219.1 beta-ketoacyl-[acyl-carrier-protein] synthase family protein [Shewanella olleyana]
MPKRCSIAITHIGLCTPIGHTPESVLANLLAGNTDAMVPRDDLMFNATTRVGAINDADLLTIPDELQQYNCRNNRLLFTAASQLKSNIEQAKSAFGKDRIGVVLGTSTSGISKGEAALEYHQQHGQFPPSYHYAQQELGSTSDFLRKLYDVNGPCYTVSTACSSSTKVFASAQRLLKANLCDVVIVGGVDSLCQLTLNGFNSLESVSKGLCNPFSENRDGINIGEGAALFILQLTEAENTQAQTAKEVLLAGIGESSDAHHISAPHPQGLGAIAAMKAALNDAELTASQVSYVNLHGTATPKNDAMESIAMHQVFAEQTANNSANDDPAKCNLVKHNLAEYDSSNSLPLCSSTKPLTGHCLGAAGAIEAAFCYLLLSSYNSDQMLPPQVWDKQQDPNNPVLPLVTPAQSTPLNYIMSNSFAFGGSNASIIFAKAGNQDV